MKLGDLVTTVYYSNDETYKYSVIADHSSNEWPGYYDLIDFHYDSAPVPSVVEHGDYLTLYSEVLSE